MKLAAMEGLNEGGKGAPFTLIGLTCTDPQLPSERMKTVKYGITIPKLYPSWGIMTSMPMCPVSKISWTATPPKTEKYILL